jgi:uncharacterized protein (DUF4415 family)
MQPKMNGDNMKAEYDFSKAKRAKDVPHLAKLQAEAAKGKTRVTMYLDDNVLDAFRARAQEEGKGYQTLINDTLKQAVIIHDKPVTEETLRRVIREEIRAV